MPNVNIVLNPAAGAIIRDVFSIRQAELVVLPIHKPIIKVFIKDVTFTELVARLSAKDANGAGVQTVGRCHHHCSQGQGVQWWCMGCGGGPGGAPGRSE